jgi:ABC-type branched-subunit amino acid transport system substrate-binding protein
VVLLASYPPDSVGLVRAATEIGLKTQLFGGAMVGMQYASLMQQLGEKLNRVVNYHLYVPSAKMNFPGIEAFLKKYQAQAKEAGTDPLGFYQPPFAYAAMQVLEQAIKATGASTTTSSQATSTTTHSTRSSAKSASTNSANGRRHACCWCSFRMCKAAGSIST